MTTKDTRYISSTDTARMIRETLKIEFPGIAFRVRKSRGGSVRVEWTDGPTQEQVMSVTGFYEGAHFDPMFDLKTSKSHTNEGGETVHYLIDYALCTRHYSRELLEKVIAYYTPRYRWDNGAPDFYIVESTYSGAYLAAHNTASRFGNEWATHFVDRELMRMSAADIDSMIANASS